MGLCDASGAVQQRGLPLAQDADEDGIRPPVEDADHGMPKLERKPYRIKKQRNRNVTVNPAIETPLACPNYHAGPAEWAEIVNRP